MEIKGHSQSPEVLQAKQRFGIVGNAPGLVGAVERSLRVAPIDLSVLITGESGTGKEFFPKVIHANSPRKHAKYIAVNCAAIPEGTIDSELFGHEKGAFTGAVASRKGYFEEADGGTIFLDEVAELPLTTQARLLRVLESGEFIKVGSSQVQKTNIRVVAATNVDMLKAVEEGRFREDLYYRLSSVQISVPPLRERGRDILLLARKFAADFAEKWRLPQISFTEEANLVLERFRWPGNVRQLKNVVEQVALFEAGNDVDSAVLRGYLPAPTFVTSPAVVNHPRSYDDEREMLMGMIMGMQRRIDALESAMAGNPQPVESVAPRQVSSSVALTPFYKGPDITPSEKFVGHADSAEEYVHYSEDIPDTADVSTAAAGDASSPQTMQEREREAIREALARNGGHRRAAAEELKISQRTLYRKIKEYGLE